jgi:hypothetical protein
VVGQEVGLVRRVDVAVVPVDTVAFGEAGNVWTCGDAAALVRAA